MSKKIFDQLIAAPTGNIKHSHFAIRKPITFDTKEIIPTQEIYANTKEYEARTTLRLRFWCEEKDLSRSIELAKESVVAEMYGDVFSLLRDAERAILEGDSVKTRKILHDIYENLRG